MYALQLKKISKKHCIIFWNLAHYEYTGRSAVVIKEDLAVRLLGMRVIGNRIRWNEKCVEWRRNSWSEIWTIYCDSDPSKISYFAIQGINWNFKINSTSSLSFLDLIDGAASSKIWKNVKFWELKSKFTYASKALIN